MPFINEFIPEPDVVKYDLEAIDRDFVVGGTNARDWTIDRDRDMYLRNVANGGGTEIEVRNQTKFSFYWHGELLTLRLDLVDGGGARGQPGWSHWRLMWINGGDGLPEHLKADKEQFMAELKEAFSHTRILASVPEIRTITSFLKSMITYFLRLILS